MVFLRISYPNLLRENDMIVSINMTLIHVFVQLYFCFFSTIYKVKILKIRYILAFKTGSATIACPLSRDFTSDGKVVHLSWKQKKDIVRTLCGHISLEIHVRTMSAQCPHNISLVRHISFVWCCADIVRTLFGHCADIYLQGYMSAQCPHYILLRFSALVKKIFSEQG